MVAPARSGQFQSGIDILGSTVDEETGTVLLQTGDVANEFPEVGDVESWQPTGFISRPSNPTPKSGACQALIMRCSDNDKCIGTRDLRSQSLAGSLGPGEFCLFSAGADGKSQGRVLGKDNGTIALYTSEGNVEGGASVALQVSPDGIRLFGPWGAITLTSEGIKLATADGAAIELAGGKATIIGTEVNLNGGSVGLGANASMPVLWGPTGIAGVASLSVKVGI